MRGISQKMLGELASGINEVTIRKYEAGDRNPKLEQLLKIANALGISINIFMYFDIETVSDVLSLIFKMDDQLDMDFTGKRNKKGEYEPNSIALKFSNPIINDQLAKWARTRDLVQKTIDSRDEFATEEEYHNEVCDMRDKANEMKQHLMDSSMVVKKGTKGIVVKNKN